MNSVTMTQATVLSYLAAWCRAWKFTSRVAGARRSLSNAHTGHRREPSVGDNVVAERRALDVCA